MKIEVEEKIQFTSVVCNYCEERKDHQCAV